MCQKKKLSKNSVYSCTTFFVLTQAEEISLSQSSLSCKLAALIPLACHAHCSCHDYLSISVVGSDGHGTRLLSPSTSAWTRDFVILALEPTSRNSCGFQNRRMLLHAWLLDWNSQDINPRKNGGEGRLKAGGQQRAASGGQGKETEMLIKNHV